MEGRKPSLKHLHIWGYPSEARPYRPNEKNLDFKTVSNNFICYPERSRSYKFYNPIIKSIFEIENVTFFEDVEFRGRNKISDIVFEEESVTIPATAFDSVHASIPIIVLIKTMLNNFPLKLR